MLLSESQITKSLKTELLVTEQCLSLATRKLMLRFARLNFVDILYLFIANFQYERDSAHSSRSMR